MQCSVNFRRQMYAMTLDCCRLSPLHIHRPWTAAEAYRKCVQGRIVHGLGKPTCWFGLDWVGSRYFWWVGLGRWSETAEAPKLFFTLTEFIDTDGHGISWVRLGWGWLGSWVQIFTMMWVGLSWISHLVGWVESKTAYVLWF